MRSIDLNSRDPVFERSAEWIDAHPGATNHDIPDDLLEFWLIKVGDPLDGIGTKLSIFTFGYFQGEFAEKSFTKENPFSISLKLLHELFFAWQLKLSLTVTHRKTSQKSSPLSAFRFGAIEPVRAWREP